MKAIFWTTTGNDIWRVTERVVFEFKNLDTGEVLICESRTELNERKFVPVKMPKIRWSAGYIPDAGEKAGPAAKAETENAETKEVRAKRKKSEYEGVSASYMAGKFRVMFWDREKKEIIYLGTFKSELLAAAAYQEHIGNTKEAVRLREEYAEGDQMPEGPDSAAAEPEKRYKGIYPYKAAGGVIRYHAQIQHNKKQKHLGTHDTIKQAAAAIKEFRKKAAEQEKSPGQFPSED